MGIQRSSPMVFQMEHTMPMAMVCMLRASVEIPKDLRLFASILQFLLHQFWHGWLNYIMVARERKSSLLDADCLQGIVLVRWFLVKEPSWISLKA
jgi:hypothetical protein